jgi:hypothetical protein
VQMWGAQLEEGVHPSSYIKTTSTSATRGGDTAVLNLTPLVGTGFSSLIRQVQDWNDGNNFSSSGLLTTGDTEWRQQINTGGSSRQLVCYSGAGSPVGTNTSVPDFGLYKRLELAASNDATNFQYRINTHTINPVTRPVPTLPNGSLNISGYSFNSTKTVKEVRLWSVGIGQANLEELIP